MKKDDKWILSHFEQLVDRYSGKAIAIVKGKVVAVGASEYQAERKAKKIYPHAQPSVLKIPTPKELVCALNIRIRFIEGSTYRLSL